MNIGEKSGSKIRRFSAGDGFQAEVAGAELDQAGIVVLDNVLTPDELAALREEVLAIAAAPPRWLKSHTTPNGFFFSFSPVSVRKLHGDASIRNIAMIFGRKAFARLCRAPLGALWYVDRIVIDRKLPAPEPITEWHADQFERQGRCIKFMLYLTDVDADNGAFSFVPGSHRLMRALAREHENVVRELHMIEDIRASAEALMARDPSTRAHIHGLLAEMEDHIASAGNSDDHYSVAAPAGSVVVFDANGIHRGGVVRGRERLIARSHCREFALSDAFKSPRSIITAGERYLLRLTSPAGVASLV